MFIYKNIQYSKSKFCIQINNNYEIRYCYVYDVNKNKKTYLSIYRSTLGETRVLNAQITLVCPDWLVVHVGVVAHTSVRLVFQTAQP